MAKYELAFTQSVLASLEQLNDAERSKIERALEVLAEDPFTEKSIELHSSNPNLREVNLTQMSFAIYHVINETFLTVTMLRINHASLI